MLGSLRCLRSAPGASVLPRALTTLPIPRALVAPPATFARAFSAQSRWRNARLNGFGVTQVPARPAPAPKVSEEVAEPAAGPTDPLRVEHPHPTIVPATHAEYNPALNTFAVVDINTRQYKVQVGDVVMVPSLLRYYDIGDNLALDSVLAIGTPHVSLVGRPLLPGCKVHVSVQEHTSTAYKRTFKMKRRKASKRMKGISPEVTLLEVTRIEWEGEAQTSAKAAATAQ